jgi:hypothetical protein
VAIACDDPVAPGDVECDLLVDRVELRILQGGDAIKTLRVTMPRGD